MHYLLFPLGKSSIAKKKKKKQRKKKKKNQNPQVEKPLYNAVR